MIEDAAGLLGTTYKGKHMGNYGLFSFHGVNNVITKRQKSLEIRGFLKGNFEKIGVKNKLITVPDGVKSVTTYEGIMGW